MCDSVTSLQKHPMEARPVTPCGVIPIPNFIPLPICSFVTAKITWRPKQSREWREERERRQQVTTNATLDERGYASLRRAAAQLIVLRFG
jgi:hypothetical protein